MNKRNKSAKEHAEYVFPIGFEGQQRSAEMVLNDVNMVITNTLKKMTRLTYTKTEQGYQSVTVLAQTRLVYVVIDEETNLITIRNLPKNDIEWQSEAESLTRAKTLAKRMLKTLGVRFDDEVRGR